MSPVLYNLEWMGTSDRTLNATAMAMALTPDVIRAMAHYRIWEYSVHNQRVWQSRGVSTTLVPLGYSPSLTNPAIGPLPESEKDIDVLFFGRCDVLQGQGKAGWVSMKPGMLLRYIAAGLSMLY